ncbi:MAG: aroB [Verrucomicrobiales bacterium]|nr:aroB [Verrucomicrobiales bacterium]
MPLGARSYSIEIGSNLLGTLGQHCSRLKFAKRCAIITDAEVGAHYSEIVRSSLESAGFEPLFITLQPGEKTKSLDSVGFCYDSLATNRLERKSFIVALGGGVIGDLGGFVAATFLRGIPFVQVPTSLLAQVDSSVGGKTGINLKAGKNLVGAFYQPKLVLCDLNTLRTLPPRELRAGLAEIVKYGIIYDAELFKFLEANADKLLASDPLALAHVIARSCEIKADVVGQDEMETGLRAILNFGHTIGHSIENTFGYGKYLHGEAISIGQIAAAWMSLKHKGLPERDLLRIKALFEKIGLPVSLPITPSKREKMFQAMQMDKKVSNGSVKFVLAREIGKVDYGIAVPEQDIHWAIDQVSSGRKRS